MANTYKRKGSEQISAVQFTGNNLKTVQNFVGDRYLDRNNKYPIPRFDEAGNWLAMINPDEPAVLWRDDFGTWTTVPVNAWIVKDGDRFIVINDDDFNAEYEVAGEPTA